MVSPDLSFYGGTWTPRDITQRGLTDVTGLSGHTVVIKIPNSLITLGATKCRLHFIGPRGEGHSTVFDNVTIGNASINTNRDAWDNVTSPAPTAVTFAGSASLTLLRHHRRMSDEITFTALAGSASILVAYNVSATSASGTTMALRQTKYPATPWPVSYTKAATAEAAIINRGATYTGTGSGGGLSYSLTRIEFK